QRLETEINFKDARKDSFKLIQWLQKQKELKPFIKGIKAFEVQPVPENKNPWGEKTPRKFLEEFYRAVSKKEFTFKAYPHFSRMAGWMILKSEIEGAALSNEMSLLSEIMLSRLAVSPEERSLVSIYQDTGLLRKLFSLELLPEDYTKVHSRRNELKPSRLIERYRSLKGSIQPTEANGMDALYNRALAFYKIAKKRENRMVQKTLGSLAAQKKTKAILITGGFHSGGLFEQFRQKGMAYIEITPRISTISGNSTYLNLMTLKENFEALRSQVQVYGPRIPAFLGASQISRPHTDAWIIHAVKNALSAFVKTDSEDDFLARFQKAFGTSPASRAHHFEVKRVNDHLGIELSDQKGPQSFVRHPKKRHEIFTISERRLEFQNEKFWNARAEIRGSDQAVRYKERWFDIPVGRQVLVRMTEEPLGYSAPHYLLVTPVTEELLRVSLSREHFEVSTENERGVKTILDPMRLIVMRPGRELKIRWREDAIPSVIREVTITKMGIREYGMRLRVSASSPAEMEEAYQKIRQEKLLVEPDNRLFPVDPGRYRYGHFTLDTLQHKDRPDLTWHRNQDGYFVRGRFQKNAALKEEESKGQGQDEPSRSEVRQVLADVLKQNKINPDEFKEVIYPAAGNYDGVLLAKLKTEAFPDIKTYHLISLSYQWGDAAERVKSKLLEFSAQDEPAEVFTYPKDYYRADLPLSSNGKRIWIDKGPGINNLMRQEKLYQTAVEKGHLRPGDIVLTVPSGGVLPYRWQNEIAKNVKVWDDDYWDNWRVSVVTEEDFEIIKSGKFIGQLRSDLRHQEIADKFYQEVSFYYRSLAYETSRSLKAPAG
ncbi:MAG TPA: hypothetical protein VD913_06415, partial [bacterium]|nr:hypothetical protein [bacterium]